MQFGYNVIDKIRDEHLRDIAAMASDKKTLVFLDTNILAYLYKLHAAARREFFTWTDAILAEKRLRIPAWSAGEYLSRVKTRSLHSYTTKNRDPDQPRKALEVMLETAALFVDDTVLRAIGFNDSRADFLSGFKNAVDALPQFTRAFKHQFDPEAVHEEIQEHLSSAILNSDVVELCARAAREGDVRAEHRLPPAFCDKDKGENRFGDLIIWFEILQHSKERVGEFQKTLFITNDEKSDWMYAPQRRMEHVRATRQAVPNDQPEIKLIDPRLVSEFQRVVGHADIVICSLPSLIEGFSKEDAEKFRQCAAAIQINIDNAPTSSNASGTLSQSTAPEAVSTEGPVELATTDVDRVERPAGAGHDAPQGEPGEVERGELHAAAPELRYNYNPDALRDGAYESDGPTVINEIIRALKSHNWYAQNPAMDKIKAIRDQGFSSTEWFVLGRNIYQAACGNSQKAMDFMVNLDIQLSRFPPETAEHLLAGMLFEIYFDSGGELRARPKATFIGTPLQQVAEERFLGVRTFILGQLEAHQAMLRFRPGDRSRVTLLLRSSATPSEEGTPNDDRRRELQSAQIFEVELIQHPEEAEMVSSRHFGSREFTVTDLVDEV
ncbi:MAG: PIN-like domain-containing protein, partial [Acidiferrobacteraceae bacterium]